MKIRVGIAVLVLPLLAAATTASAADPVKLSYDRFRNSSSVALEKITIVSGDAYDPEVTLVAAFDFHGQRLTAATAARPYLFIESHSMIWVFTRYRDVTLLVDGERIHINPVDYGSDVISSRDLYENIVVPLTKAQLLRLGRARKIEGKIGALDIMKFTLSAKDIEGLRKLAACFDPAGFRRLAEAK